MDGERFDCDRDHTNNFFKLNSFVQLLSRTSTVLTHM